MARFIVSFFSIGLLLHFKPTPKYEQEILACASIRQIMGCYGTPNTFASQIEASLSGITGDYFGVAYQEPMVVP